MRANLGTNYLPSGGKKRNTVQRNMVLLSVKRLANHPSAEQVYAETVKLHPDISKATVYRNLNVLVQEGLLRRISVANAADRFDHHTEPHYHLKCTCCGSFGDIDLPYMRGLDEKAEQASGYTLNKHDIIFEGLCPVCKNCLRQS